MINHNRFWLTFSALLVFLQGCSLQTSVKISELEQAAVITVPVAPGVITQAIPRVEKVEEINPETNDSWQYIISLFAMPEVNNPRIEREIARFLANPLYIKRIQTRAEPYLYNIIRKIEQKGLPGELALLPAIESGFKAHAYSHAHAAGLWQFIPSTGRYYGLDQNWWYDGRRDVYSSTAAATRYLQNLGQTFDNDWLLALAAYNAGGGTVRKAIRRNTARNQPTDFWSLRLPKETQVYVPRLLALAKIFANAEYYGISLKQQIHKPAFVAIDIGSQLDLAKAAQLSNISLKELFHLNPGFNRGYTPPQGPHRLLIPVENAELFKKNLAMLPFNQRMQSYRHKIKSGESLGRIAHLYKTSIRAIREVNHLKNNTIHTGHYLMIPGAKKQRSHKSFIQARFIKTGYEQLSNKVRHGQILSLKKTAKTVPTLVAINKAQARYYTVRNGDSLSAISEKFNVRIVDLRKWNASRLGKYLQPGQTLTVKSDTQPST